MKAEEARSIMARAEQRAISQIDEKRWLTIAMELIYRHIMECADDGENHAEFCIESILEDFAIPKLYRNLADRFLLERLTDEGYLVKMKYVNTVEISW